VCEIYGEAFGSGKVQEFYSLRNNDSDRCLLLLSFRHGFRVSEICGLPLDHVDIESRVLHVKRLKRGLSTTHPLRADEIRAIKAWLKIRAAMKLPATVKVFFVSEQRRPLHRSTVNYLLKTARAAASLPFSAPSSHAAPRLRLCACRPRRGYAAR
jgi:type 1 fimbriae regulatory protein FimB